MEEIKVGEYVRDKDGCIIKVDEIQDYESEQDIWYKAENTIGGTWKSMMTKHSKNIIDLIEKNDIAEVLDNWTGNKQIIYIYDDSDITELKLDIKNGFLKLLSITTAEQYNQVKYEV